MTDLIEIGATETDLVDKLGIDGALNELGTMAEQSFAQIKCESAKLAYSCWAANRIFGLPRGRPTDSQSHNGGFAGWSDRYNLARATAIRYRDMGTVLYEDTGLSADNDLAKLVAEQLTTERVKKLKHDDVLRQQLLDLQRDKDKLTSQLAQAEVKQAQDIQSQVEALIEERLKKADEKIEAAAKQAEQAEKNAKQANQRAEKSEKREGKLSQKLEKAKQQGRGLLMGQIQATIELIQSLETPPTPEEARKLKRLVDVIYNVIGSEN